MDKLIQDNLAAIRALCKAHHIKRLYAFGSVVTPSFNHKSDVDFLYEPDYAGFDFNANAATFPYDPFLEMFDLKFSLQKLLNRKVDLIPAKKFENPYFNQNLQATKRLLYSDERFEEVLR